MESRLPSNQNSGGESCHRFFLKKGGHGRLIASVGLFFALKKIVEQWVKWSEIIHRLCNRCFTWEKCTRRVRQPWRTVHFYIESNLLTTTVINSTIVDWTKWI